LHQPLATYQIAVLPVTLPDCLEKQERPGILPDAWPWNSAKNGASPAQAQDITQRQAILDAVQALLLQDVADP
jgi:hypothetical protein